MSPPWATVGVEPLKNSDPPKKKVSIGKIVRRGSTRLLYGPVSDCTPVMVLELSQVAFRLVWMVVVGTHILCAVFLAGYAATYNYLASPLAAFYYIQIWSPKSGNHAYAVYAGVFGTLGIFHVLRVFQLFFRSYREGRLVFRVASFGSGGAIMTTSIEHLTDLRRGTKTRRRKLTYQSTVKKAVQPHTLLARKLWRKLFSRRGFFGVESEHFIAIFVLREVLEVATQTYLAYRSSHLLPRVWLNTVLVLLLVTKCWSTLAVEQFFGRTPALERVVVLAADATVCVAMSVVIPSLIAAPYIAAFDIRNRMFKDTTRVYDPVFVASLVLETKLVFASGVVDFGVKLTPHLAIFLALVTIGALIVQRGNLQPPTTGIIVPSCWEKLPPPVPSNKVIPEDESASSTAHTRNWDEALAGHHPQVVSQHRRAWLHMIVKIVFCLWGAIVLGFHLHAATHEHPSLTPSCRAFTRPWLAHHAACSSLVVNCQTHGTNSFLESELEALDTSALATLAFTHCSALHIPSSLHRFTNLLVLQVYNSTVVEWGGEGSAISASSHPRLRLVSIARTQFPSGFPEGLLQPLPASLAGIEFCATNVVDLPTDLPTRWHSLAFVTFESSGMVKLPSSLLALQSFAVSLKGNRLETIPQLAAMSPWQTVGELSLENNPLRELPPALGSPTTSFLHLDLQGTNVRSLPEWTETQVLGVVYVYDTPYCSTTSPELRQRNAQCTPRAVRDATVNYPLEHIDQLYGLNLQ